MAAKTSSLCQLYSFVVVGLVVSGLNVASAQRSASTIGPATGITNITHITMGPAIGYGHFNFSDCILLDISCSVSVDLHVDGNVQTATYNLPLNAASSGTCGSKSSSISLAWITGPANLTISMTVDNQNDHWTVSSLAFAAKTDNKSLITNSTEKEVNAWQNDTLELKMVAGNGKSFKCDREQDITLQGNVKVSVAIKKMQLQSFVKGAHAEFGEADVCFAKTGGKPAEPVNTIVPIVVGCVLAGLIVILIITYLVGRCKKPGYEKM